VFHDSLRHGQVLAAGTAPIQVAYHGYPGTMGAGFIHYLAADPISAPADHAEEHFTERLLLLPFSYLTNDHRQSRREVLLTDEEAAAAAAAAGSRPAPTRAQLGFDEDEVILCSFNQLYKIEPEVFATWMRILKRVPAAKLWLLRFSEEGAHNLRNQEEPPMLCQVHAPITPKNG